MSKPQLADLKKRFQEQKEKTTTNNSQSNGDYYAFWNIAEDESAIMRTLPIANQKGAMPVLEKDHHKISIEGKDETIPCLAMYGETCPICELSRKYYKLKDEESQKMGKYYYRNRSYLFSAYIKKDPLPADAETKETAEGKVKVVQFGNQLYKKYNASLETLVKNDEIDDVPWSLTDGLDFNIVKKMGPKWAEWDLSSDFARRSTPLPAEFIESFEPVDLTKFLPANPGLEKVQRMLDAHMNDGSYSDTDSQPIEKKDDVKKETVKKETVKKETVKSEPKSEVKKEEKTEKPEVIKEETTSSDDDDDDIAAMLRKLKGRVASED